MSASSRTLRSREAAFLYYEKPQSRMHSGGIAILDGDVDPDELSSLVTERVATRPGFDAVARSAALGLGHPSWQPLEGFDPTGHVHLHDGSEIDTSADLFAEGARIFSTRLQRDRPLWEAHLVRGLPSGHSALILKTHRALHPQIGSSAVLEAICNDALAPPPPETFAEPQDSSRLLDGMAAGLDTAASAMLRSLEAGSALTSEHTITATQTLAASMPDLTLPVRRLPFNGPTSGDSHLAPTTVSFAEVREIRRTLGGGVRDVLLTAIAGAVGRFVHESGHSVSRRSMRVAVPMRIRKPRSSSAAVTNRSVLPVNVPIDNPDPVRRLRAIRTATRLMAAAKIPEWIAQSAYIGGLVPAPLQASLGALANGGLSMFNMTLSYTAGPQIPLSVGGHRVAGYTPFAPVGYGHGLGCAVYNYNQLLHIGLTGDRRACPELATIRDFFDDEIRSLKAAAGTGDIDPIPTGPDNRRIHDSEWR